MTTSGNEPSDPKVGLLDVGLYAPIGLVSLVAEQMPSLVERGRARVEQRIVLARFVGELAVNQARLELERRCSSATPAARDSAVSQSGLDAHGSGPVESADEFTGEPGGLGAVSSERPAEADAMPRSGPSADDLPIDGYEHLPASHVLSLLPELRADELDLVEEFERANRNRRTVLGRVAQLRRSA